MIKAPFISLCVDVCTWHRRVYSIKQPCLFCKKIPPEQRVGQSLWVASSANMWGLQAHPIYSVRTNCGVFITLRNNFTLANSFHFLIVSFQRWVSLFVIFNFCSPFPTFREVASATGKTRRQSKMASREPEWTVEWAWNGVRESQWNQTNAWSN